MTTKKKAIQEEVAEQLGHRVRICSSLSSRSMRPVHKFSLPNPFHPFHIIMSMISQGPLLGLFKNHYVIVAFCMEAFKLKYLQ